MRLKKKLDAAISHVKSHPALYGYMAGAVITGIAIGVVQNKLMKNFLNDKKLVDLNVALDQITDQGLNGLYFEMDDLNTLLLIPAPQDFKP